VCGYGADDGTHTVPKTRQISQKIREEVPWTDNFSVICGNDDYFPRITEIFPIGDFLLFTYKTLPDFWDISDTRAGRTSSCRGYAQPSAS
jgi:hypothetical protein